MREEQDYIRDIAEIRSMMERSSRFLSLSGWAGIMAGIYALCGAAIAWKVLHFNPAEIVDPGASSSYNITYVISLGIMVLILALGTAIALSSKKAHNKGEKPWNPTARRLLVSMAVPLFAGGLLILILISKGLIGLLLPCTLIFYGLALFNAGKFTYGAIKFLGVIQIVLGLAGAYAVEYGLLLWAVGFGVFHIVYGIYLHYKYER